jgi:TorA maturation chaperone TorD
MEKGKQIKTEMAEHALQRSNVYAFLASVYREELSADLLNRIQDPHFMGVLFDLGVSLGEEFFSIPKKELLEDLAVEYARLFLGPDKHISPHESVHHDRGDGDWGTLWGRSTVEVKKFIETAGLEYKSEFTGLPDHIGVELEFMQAVTKKESTAWEENDMEGLHSCCQIEKKFFNEHLSKWIPVFCDKIVSMAELSFYREIAGITKNFIEYENDELKTCGSEDRNGKSVKTGN